MSDETPTQKFDAAGDAPTEALGQPPAPPVDGDVTPPSENGDAKRSRGLLIAIISIAAAVLLALIVIIFLLTRPGGEPGPTPTPTESSATPTPTPTPTETPTPTPTPTQTTEPQPPQSLIQSYTASTTSVNCDGQDQVAVTFSWAANGDTLWFGVGTDNAKDEPYDTFPLNYTLDFNYQCGQASGSQKYTITVQQGGDLESETIVISE